MSMIVTCTLLILAVLVYAARNQRVVEGVPSGIDQSWKYEINKNIYIVFAIILIVVSGIRFGFIDTYAYKEMYVLSRNDLEYVNSAPWDVEAGWLYICYYLNFLFANPHTILFVSAIIINYAYVSSIKRYSVDPVVSLLMYFCIIYMDTNNGIRQMVAAAVIIIGYRLLLKRKLSAYILYTAVALLAMQLHESAVFAFIVVLIIAGKPLNFRICLFILLGIVFSIAPDLVNSIFGEMFSDSKYLDYLELSVGMTIWRALVVGIVPTVLAIIYYFKQKKMNIKIEYNEGLLINLTVINGVLYIMGLYMQYWARFAFYTAFAPIILLPKLVSSVFGEEYRRAVRTAMIILYFVFFAYNIYVNYQYGALDQFYPEIFYNSEEIL